MIMLNQVLGIEAGVKNQIREEVTKLHRITASPGATKGQTKTYSPLEDGGQTFPDEEQKVQCRVEDALVQARILWDKLINVTAQKDVANLGAKADVRVGDRVILVNVPATHLLFLDKRLDDIRKFVSEAVELDPAERWELDDGSGLHRTQPATTHKTMKVATPIVLAQATKEHPAQTQLISKDMVIGHWTTVKFSGAISRKRKVEILERVTALQEAIKYAREKANTVEAPPSKLGTQALDYIFASSQ